MTKWTRFYDLHSGGGRKLPFACIMIEADEETAVAYFTARFGRDPNNVTCTCCGPDYSVWELDEGETPKPDDYDETLFVPSRRVHNPGG